MSTDLDGATAPGATTEQKCRATLSAEWWASLAPVKRFLLDLYGNWPFAIVSVETGESRQSVKRTKTQEGLGYSSFWDEPVQSETGEAGAIASAWNADGFPTLYVLDGQGVIRFVDLRYEDLLKGVRQLLAEEVVVTDRVSRRTGSRQSSPVSHEGIEVGGHEGSLGAFSFSEKLSFCLLFSMSHPLIFM